MKIDKFDSLADEINNLNKDKQYFSIAISGGSLPKILSQSINKAKTDNWIVILTDERVVHPDSDDLSFNLIKAEILAKV